MADAAYAGEEVNKLPPSIAPVTVSRYGKTAPARPAQVVLIRDASAAGYDLALVTTDTAASPAQVIGRYAARWSVGVAIEDARQVSGTGQARNRTARAVGRTVPFQLGSRAIATAWYATAGHHPAGSHAHRTPGTPTSPSRLPGTCSPSSGVLIAANFGHLALTSRHPKKSMPSARAWANAAA